LQEACSQARQWQLNQKSIQMSVNVSSLQFVQGHFVSTVMSALQSNNLPAATIELEITEGALMNQIDAREMLYDLQNMGISIAIDDFGTGYSSLAYLRELPVDTIKIDKSFVRNLFSEGQDVLFSKALISTIVALAKHLDLEIVAEGIETSLEHHTLIELGCHIGQGYLFSKPLPAHSLEAILNQTATKTLSDDAILVV
jgi:EAL domain-containing protein (putative c-di-GMP-specific phosphodiesterase class I)